MDWICLLGCQIRRAGHPDTRIGNDDTETGRVIMSYWVRVMDGPGFGELLATVSLWPLLLVAARQCRSAGSGADVARSSLFILSLSLLLSLTYLIMVIMKDHDCNTKYALGSKVTEFSTGV